MIDLTTPRVQDVERWRQERVAKGERARAIHARLIAARESQVNPPVLPKPKREYRPPHEPRWNRGAAVRPCAGGCGRETRHNNMRAVEAPGTSLRTRGGYCTHCVKERKGN